MDPETLGKSGPLYEGMAGKGLVGPEAVSSAYNRWNALPVFEGCSLNKTFSRGLKEEAIVIGH